MNKPKNHTLNEIAGVNGWVTLKAFEKKGKRFAELNAGWECRLTKRNCRTLSKKLLLMAAWIEDKDNAEI